ncbi:helix-turn-helix domain-containing protein [Mycobacterium sp. pUA109]|uniref:helix-turn-helix domain-containing protein n=1 Tax=Mycobacterium sp. pUA109 TaxID=3238982 RepID=UPI00351B0FFC
MRCAEEFDTVQRLIADGINDCAIARLTGIPRPTVRDWRRRPQIRSRQSREPGSCTHDFASLPVEAYCYLLGLYLGDGCISRLPRVWRLRITLDAKYPGIIQRCREAIDILMPGQHAALLRRSDSCTEVSPLLQALAVFIPSAWPRQEALAADPTRALAGGIGQPGHRGIRSRSHS